MTDVALLVFQVIGAAVCGSVAVWVIVALGAYVWGRVSWIRQRRRRENLKKLRDSAFNAGYDAAMDDMGERND